MLRAITTAEGVIGPRMQTDLLDEIKSGCLDGFTYGEIERKFPKEWAARSKDKLKYRYPGGGESEKASLVILLTR